MKKILLICMVFSSLSAIGQKPELDVPWMPTHDTNHTKTIRYYTYDTVTMERKLTYTEHYDRHGYRHGPLDSLFYNEQELLVRRVSYVNVSSAQNPMPQPKKESEWNCSYSPDGVMQQLTSIYYGYSNDVAWRYTYDLVTYKTHPTFGLEDFTIRYCIVHHGVEDYCDTAYYRREYDAQGRLLQESSFYEGDFERIIYNYRPDGRLAYRIGYYYEWSDSLSYHYDANGTLTHMTGKEYDLGAEADITVRCHPDGRMIEKRCVWQVYLDEGEMDAAGTEIYDYDNHGLLLRIRIEDLPYPVFECERDYWE